MGKGASWSRRGVDGEFAVDVRAVGGLSAVRESIHIKSE